MSNAIRRTRPDLASPWYWLIGGLLVLYVGLCTGKRDHLDWIDAWEHHRAIKALVEEGLGYTGNPTLSSPVPSLRYTPYTVALAALCRQTGLDPYRALSLAAVASTILLVLGVPFLLGAYGEASSSTGALLMIVGLYGTLPHITRGHPNSFALSDLPCQQVNPSNFSEAMSLVVWGLFARTLDAGRWRGTDLVIALLTAVAVLNHAMTGLLTLIALGIMSLASGSERRSGLILRFLGIATMAMVLCVFWPWFDFLKASRIKLPKGLVVDYINWGFLTTMCVPGVILGLAALCERGRLAVRHFLLIGYACYLGGVLAYVLPDDVPFFGVMGRLPLAGLIFLQLALGIYASRAGLLSAGSWAGRIRALFQGTRPETNAGALEVIVTIGLVALTVPQLWLIPREPYLGRTYVARLLGRDPCYHPLRPLFASLLEPVGRHDVVLSDPKTMGVVPSIRGRIVSSVYLTEALVPDQVGRAEDVTCFFLAGTTRARRIEILERYHVKWIIINRYTMGPDVSRAIIGDCPVARKAGDLSLLDASSWRRCQDAG